jgi:hypothetical protein
MGGRTEEFCESGPSSVQAIEGFLHLGVLL